MGNPSRIRCGRTQQCVLATRRGWSQFQLSLGQETGTGCSSVTGPANRDNQPSCLWATAHRHIKDSNSGPLLNILAVKENSSARKTPSNWDSRSLQSIVGHSSLQSGSSSCILDRVVSAALLRSFHSTCIGLRPVVWLGHCKGVSLKSFCSRSTLKFRIIVPLLYLLRTELLLPPRCFASRYLDKLQILASETSASCIMLFIYNGLNRIQ